MRKWTDNMKMYVYIREIWHEAMYMIHITEDKLT
jgi:hypothetical protein